MALGAHERDDAGSGKGRLIALGGILDDPIEVMEQVGAGWRLMATLSDSKAISVKGVCRMVQPTSCAGACRGWRARENQFARSQ